MICERCHQEPATIYLNKIVDGEKIEIHLCSKCAKETQGLYMNSDLSFQSLLSGLLDIKDSTKNFKKFSTNQQQILKCSKCGMTYKQFRKKGKFGCSNCYDTFSDQLSAVFKRIHGSSMHTGKIPNKTGGELLIKKQILELQSKLQTAIKKEEFEDAAKYRDAIRALKKEGSL